MPQPIDWPAALTILAEIVVAVTLGVFITGKPPEPRFGLVTGGSVKPPLPQRERYGTRDGAGAGDHDRPFRFGRRPYALLPYPFNTHEYARLLLLRSRWQAGLLGSDDAASTSERPLEHAITRGRLSNPK